LGGVIDQPIKPGQFVRELRPGLRIAIGKINRCEQCDDGFLRAAFIGDKSEKAKIQAAIVEIQAQLKHRGPEWPRAAVDRQEPTVPKRKTMSASARRRIAASRRKRWAAVRTAKAAQPKPKRRLSAAGQNAVVVAIKKRWAAVRAAKVKAARKQKASKAAYPISATKNGQTQWPHKSQ
jgi:hypothetical protein